LTTDRGAKTPWHVNATPSGDDGEHGVTVTVEMASDSWFRSSAWDAAARSEFEARLARARDYNRPQYLRIKAISLQDAGNTDAAGELFRRVIDEYPESLDAALCAEMSGNMRLAAGDFSGAEESFRRSLELRPDLNGTTGEVHIGLAEALTALGRPGEALEALGYIPVSRLTLSHSHCRWNAALAEAALAVGEPEVAADAAARALSLLDVPDQFSRHPGFGRAHLDADQVARLRAIAERRTVRPARRLRLLRRR